MLNCLKPNSYTVPGVPALVLLSTLLGACQTAKPPPLAAITEAEDSNSEIVIDQHRLDYQAALVALKQGNTETAIETFERLSNVASNLEYLFTNLGLAHLKLDDESRAEIAFERAISQNRQDAIAYNHLGIIKRMRGEFDAAKVVYQQAIDIDQNYAQAHLNLGILYDIYMQDLKLALRQYQTYQSLTNGEDKTVDGWIVDIERRLKSG